MASGGGGGGNDPPDNGNNPGYDSVTREDHVTAPRIDLVGMVGMVEMDLALVIVTKGHQQMIVKTESLKEDSKRLKEMN
ncbi:hypothetical protein F5880DRAFT_1619492 [Lentinula raphanica]|nr:hypothetical protein F5880DRAFT_1619492 [Lentinula raphanica]